MNSVKCVLTLIVTVIISMLIAVKYIENKNKIYSIDLGKIISTQMLLAGRMASTGVDKPRWMMTIKDTSAQMKMAISSIAGNHIVIVGPAIVQGTIDITDQVLKKLGLPTKLPNVNISQADLIPSLIPKSAIKTSEPMENSSQPSPEKKTKAWLLP